MIIYPDSSCVKLGYDEVCLQIARLCSGKLSKEAAEQLKPEADVAEVNRLLDQSYSLLEIRRNGLVFPDFHYVEAGRELSMLSIGDAVLEGAQFLLLRELSVVASGLIRGVSKLNAFPALQQMVYNYESDETVKELIDKVLDENGRVKSSASRELAAIRRSIDDHRKNVNRIFDGLLRKYRKLGWLREYDESVYHDRRVLAVVAENKNKIEGIIHGSSETGNTAFLEPAELVSINNELASELRREEKEVRRILKQLTREVALHKKTLLSFYQLLGVFDLLEAKVKWARAIGGVRPRINENCNRLFLKKAFHPLLLQKNQLIKLETIPLEMELTPDKSIMVISGPNAGGKSIALKTVGLLQMLAQSGVLIPVHETSEIPVFAQILVDIGDDQSIDQQLSTYSSRLKKQKHFLRVADARTLLLLDEFGTGSDPELGGAIAESILVHLLQHKPWGVITTHFGNIKIAAQQLDGLRNASMLFNEQSLEPMYRLKMDAPGSSYTFEVARKIGMDRKVLDLARKKVDQGKVRLDRLLVDMQESHKALEHERNAINQERELLKKELGRIEAEWDEIRLFKASRQKDEFKRLIERGKKYDELIALWNSGAAKKDVVAKIAQEGEKRKQKELKTDVKTPGQKKRGPKKKPAPRPLMKGDKVRLHGGRSTGIIDELNQGKATVLFGNMKLSVKTEELVLVMKKSGQ